MPKLGKTQKAVYEFICIYIEENFIPPTVREIGAAVGLKSTSTVHMHLQNLAAKGLIILTPSKQRSITLPKSAAPVSAMSGMSIPLVGSVAAGQPILAEENIQDYFSVPESFLRGRRPGEVFALNVQGESMIEIGIRDGDTLIVDKETEVFEGDIIIARVSGETATVKRLYFEKEEKIRLQPENQSMEPIIVDASDVAIDGKVVGLIRKY
ncbi:MAG: transcriptional repressor LexA [Clostridium sp.]|nr:transcriptional repressor LexA [Clostridium sp.]